MPSADSTRPVVLIDDEPEVASIVRGLLVKGGFSGGLCAFTEAAAAMKFLAQASLDGTTIPARIPCLVIVDLNMPVVNGLEVLRWVKDHPRLEAVRLVVLSGSDDEESRAKAAAAGADAYWVKYPAAEDFRALLTDQ